MPVKLSPEGKDEKVRMLGVDISKLTLEEFLVQLDQLTYLKDKAIVQYANIHVLNMAYQDEWLRNFYRDCHIVFCDGYGVKLASTLLGSPIPERFSPPDWLPLFASRCVKARRSLYFLGGAEGVAEKAAHVLINQIPGLQIVGTHHGYFSKGKEDKDNKEVLHLVNTANPDILVVGFGTPIQERWIDENLAELKMGTVIVVGAMFDYLSGSLPRGPRWMTDHGLEWLSRLIAEPGRLWKRYLFGLPLFFVRVIKQRFGFVSRVGEKA